MGCGKWKCISRKTSESRLAAVTESFSTRPRDAAGPIIIWILLFQFKLETIHIQHWLFDAGLLDSLWISSRTIPTSPMANDPKWLIIFNIFFIIRTEGKTCSGQGVSTVSCWVVFANFLVITFVNWPRQQQFPPKWPPTLQHLRSEDTRLDRGRVMAAALSMQIYQTRYMETDSDPCKNWIASKTFRFKYIRRIH